MNALLRWPERRTTARPGIRVDRQRRFAAIWRAHAGASCKTAQGGACLRHHQRRHFCAKATRGPDKRADRGAPPLVIALLLSAQHQRKAARHHPQPGAPLPALLPPGDYRPVRIAHGSDKFAAPLDRPAGKLGCGVVKGVEPGWDIARSRAAPLGQRLGILGQRRQCQRHGIAPALDPDPQGPPAIAGGGTGWAGHSHQHAQPAINRAGKIGARRAAQSIKRAVIDDNDIGFSQRGSIKRSAAIAKIHAPARFQPAGNRKARILGPAAQIFGLGRWRADQQQAHRLGLCQRAQRDRRVGNNFAIGAAQPQREKRQPRRAGGRAEREGPVRPDCPPIHPRARRIEQLGHAALHPARLPAQREDRACGRIGRGIEPHQPAPDRQGHEARGKARGHLPVALRQPAPENGER